ncbi:hypothetical protein IKG06_02665 [Candidatus Saccharibacteria bacterium]|nr:hypothetical protein [Candidatus Saccharibacteria bacterium]
MWILLKEGSISLTLDC